VSRPQPIELEQARGIIMEHAAALGSERIPLRDALGRRLAEDVRSAASVPAFDNSAMDGFAVRAADTRGARPGAPVALQVAGESRAGRPAAATLGDGEAIRISTGAVVPAGADAVVRVEDTRSDDGSVHVEEEIEAGRDIRWAGEDVEPDRVVLRKGARIGTAEVGVLASLGAPLVLCHRRPRIAVITSGDELLEPGQEMRPGGVYDSNGYSVSALAEAAGAETFLDGPVPDDLDATREAISTSLDSDLIVLCGGVSVGEHDHVKQALADLGVEERFWGVALKPGKPTWFGTYGATLVFGLPGNPVSAMVTFVLLVRPALMALGGSRPQQWRPTVARLSCDYDKRPGRTHAVRCRLDLDENGWHAHPTGPQGSHILTSMLGADCLALLPAARGPIAAGERVEVELLDRGWEG
jgi:molybdopterin molybdotransferase